MHLSRILCTTFATAAICLFPLAGAASAQAPGGQSPSQQPSTQGPRTMQSPNTPATMPETTTPARVDDKKFLKDAAVGGMTEVELGKLAAGKGSSDEVKQFGQKMVDDHSKANDELKQLAAKENVPVPESLDSKHQSRVDKLSKLSGPDFDKAYMKDQLKDHEQDVREFQNEAQNGSDPNVQQFASKTLPTLQEHLEMAKNVNKTTKKGK